MRLDARAWNAGRPVANLPAENKDSLDGAAER